jgi:enolase
MDAARYSQRHRCPVVMSVRSGETEDDILSDISVALNAGVFKIGGPHGSDRGKSFNRFLEIEAELGPVARYAGRDYAQLE